MNDEKTGNVPVIPHNLILENRNMLTLTGVSDVDSFDEQTVAVFTQLGELTVRGSDLHINRLSVETGELTVEGKIDAVMYAEPQPSGGGFFSKMFR